MNLEEVQTLLHVILSVRVSTGMNYRLKEIILMHG